MTLHQGTMHVLTLVTLVVAASAVGMHQRAEAGLSAKVRANPIRKVVTMLQIMKKKVEAQGEKDKELYEKFMCYCKNSGAGLKNSIAAATTKIPEVTSDIEEKGASLEGLKVSLKEHKADRETAKTAIVEAKALREKEAAAFAQVKADSEDNVAALTKAIAALTKGMTGFLQTATAATLKTLVLKLNMASEYDRDELVSFLSGSQDGEYAPQSGEILGILKQMKETMSKGLSEAEAIEAESIKAFEGVLKAKEAEIAALTKTIESKTESLGELGVEIVDDKHTLSETQAALADDKKFLEDMDKNCAGKTATFEENNKIRAAELVAISETIKVLNDDDALDLFKKTLPSASASFMQLKVTMRQQRAAALAVISKARRLHHGRPELDFMALAIQSKKVTFEKVASMIDDMVALLGKEQVDDDKKKGFCIKKLDEAEDKKKDVSRTVSDLETWIEDAKEGIASVVAEIEGLEKGILALDKSVAEAGEQRKTEHDEFTELLASDTAASELLAYAKNRLNKFYNPDVYKAPPTTSISEEERLYVAGGGITTTAAPGGIADTGISVPASFVQVAAHKVAPPPPPESMGAYQKSSEGSAGVIAMINLLIKDLDKEIETSKIEEKQAQADYEKMTADAAEKRADDVKMLTDKGAIKGRLESDLEAHSVEKTAAVKELMGVEKYLLSLHADCDWLLKYYDVRKEARAGEIDSLTRAKDVLNGADYSLLQSRVKHRIKRVH